MTEGLSICPGCNELFIPGEGYTKKYCKSSCYSRDYYQNNKDKLKEYHRRYYSTHKSIAMRPRKRYIEDPDKLRDKSKVYYWSHRAKILERAKQKKKDERIQATEKHRTEQFNLALLSLHLAKYHNSYQDVCDLFQEITKILPGAAYIQLNRGQKLFPAFLFLYLKLNGENISIITYSEAFQHLDKDAFKRDLIKLKKLSSGYRARDRKAIIKIKLRNVTHKFELCEQFLTTMLIISEMFWSQLRETTDDVATGTIYALSLVKWGNSAPTISKVCKHLGIAPSSVLYQVKHKILKLRKKSEFKTIIGAKKAIIQVIDQGQRKMKIPSLYNNNF